MERQRLSAWISTAATLFLLLGGIGVGWAAPRDTGIPDYFNTPNWAYSPPLRKFVDKLPGLGAANANLLGQFIPVAVPDKTTYPGSDYYEIEVVEFTEQMHTDLPGGTKLRGYRQTNATGPTAAEHNKPHYLGPLIVADKGQPVRIKLTNSLPTGAAGDLFIPVDTTIMGSGEYMINYDPETKTSAPETQGMFSQNRATLHLHGGRNPWISDGTAHQWITPRNEATGYPKGVSVSYVPDMWFDQNGNTIASCAGKTSCSATGATNNPGPGSQTFFWTNQQSSRMMFYHDHSWGITRLNVYVGEAAGFILRDDTEKNLINANIIPADEIPLVIQDKTFVDAATILNTDPTWIWGRTPGTVSPWSAAGAAPVTGDLWWPHVYMPAENPFNPDMSGMNPYGRWMYGPWFWPPTTGIPFGPVANPYYDPNCNPAGGVFCQPPEMPGTPNPSWGAEAFMDTPIVNGTAYPKLEVEPKAYRFRILNAAHDRFFNLQIYEADPDVIFEGRTTEVKMVPAAATPGFPDTWPTDGREGGVPDPATAGPSLIQIGTEGGFLPKPVVLPNQPINWVTDPTMFTAGIVLQQNQGGGTLMLGPAERADVIIDFSAHAGKTLILYNDAPAPWPARDPHYDYFTKCPDRTDMGGAPSTPVGLGPNTRTIMQIVVAPAQGTPTPFNLTALQDAFVPPSGSAGVFKQGQEEIIVGQVAYNEAYNASFPATWPNWGISRISDTALSFAKANGSLVSNYPMKPKAIQDEMGETYDDYGRMSAKLGLELPFTTALNQTFVMQNFVDPPTEIVDDGVQIWKITHNGVDTHPIHFHLFEVQLINRVAWDGFIYLPDPNELGWKDTIRVSPLEDTIVALRPVRVRTPFALPNSIRPLNPMTPLGSTMGFTNIDPFTAQAINPPVVNKLLNFGWEYVWHCHILSHEENDMMRPIVFNPNAKKEILWRNSADGRNLIWNMDGITRTGVTTLSTIGDQNWSIEGAGDFNDDGKRDILWRNYASGSVKVWYMDGAARIDIVSLPSETDLNWKIVGVADFNSDSKPDILWRNTSTGANRVWYMDGVALKGVASVSAGKVDWDIVGAGDFNSDGKPDILWRHKTAGSNMIWNMDGVRRLSIATLPKETDMNWTIVSAGDFNSDVYTDILWRNKATGANRVWYMENAVRVGVGTIRSNTDLNWKIVD